MRTFALRFLATLLLSAAPMMIGCEDKKPAPKAASSSSAATTKSVTATRQVSQPKALDVAMLKKSLKCGSGGHGPCEVLAEMKECIPWTPITKSGDGRWLGGGYVVSQSKFVPEFTLLRSKRVAADQVGPGQIAAKVGVARIPDDRAAEKRHAEKALRKYKRGDVTKPINLAVRYIKQRTDWPESFAMKADANQIYVAVSGGAHLCARKDQRLIVVKRAGNRAHPADGVYAIMWPVSW